MFDPHRRKITKMKFLSPKLRPKKRNAKKIQTTTIENNKPLVDEINKKIDINNSVKELSSETSLNKIDYRNYDSDDGLYKIESEIQYFVKNKQKIDDFTFIRPINKGAFGKVYLVKRKSTNNFYAMKIINFVDYVKRNP